MARADDSSRLTGRGPVTPATLIGTLALGAAPAAVLSAVAPRVWLVLLTDGVLAAALAASAAGWGAWPVAWLRLEHRRAAQPFCIASGLGLGFLSLAALGLGVAGLLTRWTAWILLALGLGLGLLRLSALAGLRRADAAKRGTRGGLTVGAVLALATLVPAACVALFGSALPPGVLWPAEAGGYDALEYHLQTPREYYEAGRIAFLPHNVYASFPQQMEMLYLLLMHLNGDVDSAALAAQMLHALCGALAVLTLAAWAPGEGPWPAVLTALAAAGVPWLAYLACLAYVELGMLLFAALAAGLVLEGFEGRAGRRTALLAGAFAGLAGGCKYTGLALVPASLIAAWIASRSIGRAAPGPARGGANRGGAEHPGAARGAPSGSPDSRPGRAAPLVCFTFGAALAFAPWAVRNAAFTGNPIFPFAAEWLGGRGWSSEQAAQWRAGHAFRPEGAPRANRASAALHELFGSGMFGPAIFLAAAAGAAACRTRASLCLLLWTLAMVAVWGAFTHVPGRFIVPIVVPLALLAGRAAATLRTPLARGGLALLLAGGALYGSLVRLGGELAAVNRRLEGALPHLVGAGVFMAELNYVNRATPPDAYVWLVGEARGFYVRRRFHYTVVFNRDPWIEYARGGTGPAECVAWLARRGVSHVVFNWSEIDRLASTYGFAEVVNRPWLAGLSAAGLERVDDAGIPPEVEVYRVPRIAPP